MPKRAGAARLNAISSRHYNQIIERFERLGTWAWDVSSGVMRWSDGLRRALGYDEAGFEPSAELMLAMAHPDDRWSVQDLLRDAEDPPGAVVRLRTALGNHLWFSCHREVFYAAPGTPIVLGVMHDVTEMKLATSTVGQRGRLLGSLVSLLDGMLWRSHSDGTVHFDIGWCEFTGTTLAENRGDGWLQSIHPDDRPGAMAAWAHAVATSSLYSTSYRVRRHDGGYRRFEVRASPLLDEGGEVLEWVGYCAPDRNSAAGPSEGRAEAARPAPAEVRAARAFLGWSVRDLADRSGVSTATLTRYEHSGGGEGCSMRPSNLLVVRRTLEQAGVGFEGGRDGRNSLAFHA